MYKTQVQEDSPLRVLHRLKLGSANLQQADVASIAYTASTLDAGTVTDNNTIPTSVISDDLQYGYPWSADSAQDPGDDGQYGYNFDWTAPAACFPTGSDIVDLEIVLTLSTGDDPINLKWRCTVTPELQVS